MKRRRLLVVIASLAAFPAAVHAGPCTPVAQTEFLEFARENFDGTGIKRWRVQLQLAPADHGQRYEGMQFSMGQFVECDCPDAHKDCTPPHSYAHIHWAHSLPHQGFISPTIQVTVTPTNAVAFWDDEYKPADGYTRVGGMDVSQNCHGLSLQLGTWIEAGMYGVAQIVQKCWQATGVNDPAAEAAITIPSYGHSIALTGFKKCGAHMLETVIKTREKYRNSPEYKREGDCPGLVLKQQFGGGANFLPLPLGNYTHYKRP